MMFEYGNNWPFWQVALMWIGMIAFWGMLIWGVYTFATNATRRPAADQIDRKGDGAGEARQILDQRLAKGEIDADEYRRMRDLIVNSPNQ
jgi:putative membrane protein